METYNISHRTYRSTRRGELLASRGAYGIYCAAMPVAFDTDGHVVTITIHGGAPGNTFDPATTVALNERLAEFDAAPELRVAVLAGAGDDFGTSAQVAPADAAARFWSPPSARPGSAAFSRIPGFAFRPSKPVVGAIRGRCFGAGLVFVGHVTDVRVAGDTARFGFDELSRGVGGVAVKSRLQRQIPQTALMWMAVAGGELDAPEAYRVGLVNEVVPDAQVLARALDVARGLAQTAPMASMAEKLSLQLTDGLPQNDLSFYAASVGVINRLHADVAEGVAAFNEKRTPHYHGVESGPR
jgi:enoyl-CoA hydratase/carnithine racemase